MRKISWRWETSLAGVDAEGVLYVEDDVSEEEIYDMIQEAVDFETNIYYDEESFDTLD